MKGTRHIISNIENLQINSPDLQPRVRSSRYWSDETVHHAADWRPVYSFQDSFTQHVPNSFCRQVTTHQVPARPGERMLLEKLYIFKWVRNDCTKKIQFESDSHVEVSEQRWDTCPLAWLKTGCVAASHPSAECLLLLKRGQPEGHGEVRENRAYTESRVSYWVQTNPVEKC